MKPEEDFTLKDLLLDLALAAVFLVAWFVLLSLILIYCGVEE